MVQKIKDFILKDVQSENETKKTAVTLRISALMLCLYFLTLFAVFRKTLHPRRNVISFSDFYLGVRLELRCTTFCVCASGSQFYRERGNDGNENRRNVISFSDSDVKQDNM